MDGIYTHKYIYKYTCYTYIYIYNIYVLLYRYTIYLCDLKTVMYWFFARSVEQTNLLNAYYM